ncbi:MAG: tetratricopeptide repeat protein, partial [Planctomycetota bacterium]
PPPLLDNPLGAAAGALRPAERGLRDHPGEVRLLTVRAQARTALGELDEAEREWRALVAAQPGSLDAVIGLGGCLEALGRACDAADLFIDRGFAGDEGEAARSWRAQFELVRVLVACGRLDDTIGPLERALALEPQRARIAVELAEQYHRAGRSDDALPLLDRWLGERGFVDRELRTTAHYRRARILANRGEMARAREDYEAVLAREPAHTGALRGLGTLLLRSGEEGSRARGRALLERFRHHAPLSDEIRVARNNVRRAPDRPALRVALIELLLKVPDLDAARVELADFAARLPRSPELPRLRARIAVAELAPGPGKGER